ncbi:MAG: hypothetical protein M3Q33_14675 [Acidobacteriota bacterium]|nr:hypothetical protein [Acidobacteriota bacterium]
MSEENFSDGDKTAFDYAWKWFDFHGKQRMQLFNYFLIITGILANAYVTALDKKFFDVGAIVCILGVLQSLGFVVFDIRSRVLTERAEKALHAFEHEKQLFSRYKYKNEIIEICLPLNDNSSPITKMKYWIWAIEIAILVLFICGTFYAYKLR